ncbi:MAG: phage head-tail connector protein [Firmicutes bacterium]|nr:phage head-tail connector protein [Bacillota bacterium]
MTDLEKLAALKLLIKGSYSDEILSAYLKMAGQKVINRAYPYDDTVTSVPVRYEHNQLQIAAYMIHKLGAEGQTAHTENGISRRYENADVPASMLSDIVPHVGVL